MERNKVTEMWFKRGCRSLWLIPRTVLFSYRAKYAYEQSRGFIITNTIQE